LPDNANGFARFYFEADIAEGVKIVVVFLTPGVERFFEAVAGGVGMNDE
jgi:hypothetical protein